MPTTAVVIAMRLSPYRMRFDLHVPSVRLYAKFSWPIMFAAVAGLIIRQGQVFAFDAHLGLAGAGFITLAVTITRYADRADQIGHGGHAGVEAGVGEVDVVDVRVGLQVGGDALRHGPADQVVDGDLERVHLADGARAPPADVLRVP